MLIESGTHGDFTSPTKPQPPTLREPNSQPFLFSETPKKPLFRAPSFTTPQNGKIDLDFSSGPENPSSPEQADNEDTPEPKSGVLFKGVAMPEKRHHPMYGRFGSSPGRGEVPRGNYSNIVAKRVQKRRRRERDEKAIVRRRSEDEESRHSTSSDGDGQGIRSSWLSYIEAHPGVPHILSWYAQLLLNVFLIFATMRIFWNVWETIQSDIIRASEAEAADALAEINMCAREYVGNRCGMEGRPPALETICENWSRCMNRDPDAVRKSRVTASMFAEILNGFVEPISLKTMV
jgi:hypothetical protein